jgi:hypothetical protein
MGRSDLMKKVDFVIGYIDAYGAIHHHGYNAGQSTIPDHAGLWPMQTHKLWRFKVSDWQLENSILSKENLTKVEAMDVEAFLLKHYTPPNWWLQGEEWIALGRPRSGKKYEAHCKKWDAIMSPSYL